jgi:hypothetical protein
MPCLVLACLAYTRPVLGKRDQNAPRWGGRQRCWPAASLPPPWVYLGLLVVQAVTRVPLSFCLGPRLVNARSIALHPPGPRGCFVISGSAAYGFPTPGLALFSLVLYAPCAGQT